MEVSDRLILAPAIHSRKIDITRVTTAITGNGVNHMDGIPDLLLRTLQMPRMIVSQNYLHWANP